MLKNLFFDLDGTLLDTIFDIKRAINDALQQCGYSYSMNDNDMRFLMGDGLDMLVRRALREKGNDEIAFQNLKSVYRPLYKLYQEDHTCPFSGLTEVLIKLKKEGARLFVVTNKPHELAKIVVAKYFPEDLFEEVVGQQEGVAPKPNPASVDKIVEEHHLNRGECLYIGDSHVDIATGNNARMASCLVTWGYEQHYENVIMTADFVAEKPSDLFSLVLHE